MLLYSDVILVTTILLESLSRHYIFSRSNVCKRMTLRIYYTYDEVLCVCVYIFQRKYVCSQTTEQSKVNGKERERGRNVNVDLYTLACTRSVERIQDE
jgi:hypothetical protein